LTTCAHQRGLLNSFESTALDAYVATAAPRSGVNVVIVTITEDDYRNPELFGGRSPLNASKLRILVDAILAGKPAVLGVDVATPDPAAGAAFESLNEPRVVWVQDAFLDAPDSSASSEWKLDRVLGSDSPPEGDGVGLSLFPRDADGIVRRYYRGITLTTDRGSVTRPSLAWAVLRMYCARETALECGRVRADPDAAGESLWFNFAGDRYTFRKIPAGAILRTWMQDRTLPTDDLSGAIVLLGGTFAAGRDAHATPLAEVSGVELTAFAIESELTGGGIRPSHHWTMLAAELAAAVFLVWMNWRWPPGSRWNVMANAGAILLLAAAGSYVAFRAFGYWASFIPIGAGVWLHQFYERARDADHARRELEVYRQRYGPL
jgi:CHASE2 domain-containing sensor protein